MLRETGDKVGWTAMLLNVLISFSLFTVILTTLFLCVRAAWIWSGYLAKWFEKLINL